MIPSRRADEIQPFQVMDVLARAREMEARGVGVIHMEIGEPDFSTPQGIVEAGIDALKCGHTHYTPALGLPDLRGAISRYYSTHFGLQISSHRIAVTPGSSGALQLALSATLDPGDEVLMADPGYPCNRHFVHLLAGQPTGIAVDETSQYQLTAALIEKNWSAKTKAVLLASPSNPTGTCCPKSELERIVDVVTKRNAVLIVDEIYQSLVYDTEPESILSVTDNVIVVNSFSKYFGMTGWRVGWLVMPGSLNKSIDKLAQNFFLATNTPAQYAALAAFEESTLQELERRRLVFQDRRDYLICALKELGFVIPSHPQGAFYLYAKSSSLHQDSHEFVNDLLEKAAVALTPGNDFGSNNAQDYVRFAYTTEQSRLEQGIERIREYLSDR